MTITNHGRPVAVLSPVRATTGLAALRAEGRISQPGGSFRDAVTAAVPTEGPSLTDAVVAARGEDRL